MNLVCSFGLGKHAVIRNSLGRSEWFDDVYVVIDFLARAGNAGSSCCILGANPFWKLLESSGLREGEIFITCGVYL